MSVIAPIFRDAKHQILFEENGFVKIPLLDDAEVGNLRAFYEESQPLHAVATHLHHTTTDTRNAELIRSVNTRIRSVLMSRLDKFMANIKPLACTFHIKEVGSGSATKLHQDPTFVDESMYCSANVWVALHDIDGSNGNLFFVNGSNRVSHKLGVVRITPSYTPFYEGFSDALQNMVTHVPLKKGEAVIFSNSTIHGATENISGEARLAATMLVCSSDADWLLYYRDREKGPIGKYRLTSDDFSYLAQYGMPPKQALLGYVDCSFPQIGKDEFMGIMGEKNTVPMGYFQRLRNIFKKKLADESTV